MKNTEDILEINKRQKEFYNEEGKKPEKNIASKLWSSFRNGALSDFRKNSTSRIAFTTSIKSGSVT
jgi:hypothetical protein